MQFLPGTVHRALSSGLLFTCLLIAAALLSTATACSVSFMVKYQPFGYHMCEKAHESAPQSSLGAAPQYYQLAAKDLQSSFTFVAFHLSSSTRSSTSASTSVAANNRMGSLTRGLRGLPYMTCEQESQHGATSRVKRRLEPCHKSSTINSLFPAASLTRQVSLLGISPMPIVSMPAWENYWLCSCSCSSSCDCHFSLSL